MGTPLTGPQICIFLIAQNIQRNQNIKTFQETKRNAISYLSIKLYTY